MFESGRHNETNELSTRCLRCMDTGKLTFTTPRENCLFHVTSLNSKVSDVKGSTHMQQSRLFIVTRILTSW